MTIRSDFVYSTFDKYERSEYFYNFVGKQDTDFLVGRLLVEKKLKNESLVHSYYNMLSKGKTTNAPFWTAEEYNEYALRLGYAPFGLFDQGAYNKRLDLIREVNLPRLKVKQPHFNITMFKKENLDLAYSQLYSHSIPFSKKRYEMLKKLTPINKESTGWAFIPFLDLLNYKRQKIDMNVHPSEVFDFHNKKTFKILLRMGITKDSDFIRFSENGKFDEYPLFEYLIAHNKENNIWNFLSITNGKELILSANKDYEVGEEIRYEYSPLSTNELLVSHNILDIPNPYENMVLKINSTIVHPSAIEICSTELDCVNLDGGILIFKFNWFQINHRFLTFIRISNLLASMKDNEIPKNLNGIIAIALKKEFYNGYREIEVWKTYYQAIESFMDFSTSINDDRKFAKTLDSETIKSKIVRFGIYQKQLAYKHLIYSQKKWMKALHHKILLGNFKKMILATHDEEKAKDINPELLTADDLQLMV